MGIYDKIAFGLLKIAVLAFFEIYLAGDYHGVKKATIARVFK